MQSHGHVVAGAVELAGEAMQWPDSLTQIRATAVCRTVATAAGASLNPTAQPTGAASAVDTRLQALVVPGMLRHVVRALAVATDGHAISEMLLLVRSIVVACASWAVTPNAVLSELVPAATSNCLAQVRAPPRPALLYALAMPLVIHHATSVQLTAELEANRTEKHQKDVIKRFFVALGFANLDANTDSSKSTGVTPVSTSRLARAAAAGARPAAGGGDAIQWPDLYDINVP